MIHMAFQDLSKMPVAATLSPTLRNKSMMRRRCSLNRIHSCWRSSDISIGCRGPTTHRKWLIRNIMTASPYSRNRKGNSKKIMRIKWLRDDLTLWPKLRKDREEWKQIWRRFIPKPFKDKCTPRNNRSKRAGLKSSYSVNRWINMPRCSEIGTCWSRIRGWIFWIRDKASMRSNNMGSEKHICDKNILEKCS